MILDYAIGTTAPARGDLAFWCRKRVAYEYPLGFRFKATLPTTVKRRGGTHAFACDAHGAPVDRVPSSGATAEMGAQIGDLAVVATADGYLGFRLGK